MILSVCIALFITNGFQSDLLSCPPRDAETQALLGSGSRAATTQVEERGSLDEENHILGPSDPRKPARMWDLWSYSKDLCKTKSTLSIWLGGMTEQTLTLAKFGSEAPEFFLLKKLPDPSISEHGHWEGGVRRKRT